MRKIKLAAVSAALLAVTTAPLQAAETTNTFTVTMTVISTCAVAATPLDFGTAAGSIGADIDAESTIEVVCSAGTPWDLTLGAGGGSAAPAPRAMVNGADGTEATYNLYTDDTRTVVWDETGGQVTGIGDGSAQDVPVYGRVFPQTLSQGVYTDTIVATLTF